ncbi:MAG: hypothetical protein AMXMBFR64_11850 [Myxococcales bacterium]
MLHRLLPLFVLLLAGAAAADTPALYLTVDQAAVPGGKAEVQVRAREGGGKADVHVFAVGKPLELLGALRDARRIELEDTPVRDALTVALRGAARAEPQFGLSHVRSFQADVPSGYETRRIPVETKRAGLYVVEVDLLGQAAYALISATSLATVTKRDAGEALVFVADRASGVARPGVSVVVSDGQRTLATGTTGRDGTWRGAVPYVPELRVIAFEGADVCLGLTEHYPASVPTPRVYLTTERPLYKPGETVYFKGIARVPAAAGLGLPPAGAATVRVLDALGGGVAEVVAPLNAHGTFSGSFVVPAGATAGRFRLVAAVAGGSYEGAFLVEDFRKPAFEVRVGALRPQVVGGDDVAVRIRAELYSGGVLKGAPVQWSVLRSRFDRPSWLDVDRSGYLSEREGAALESEVLKQGQETLNEKGELVIELGTEKSGETWVYRFTAVVTGPDGQRVSGSGSAAVTAAAFRLAARTEPLVVRADEAVTVEVGARDYADRAVQTQVTVRALLLDTTVEPRGPAQGGDVVRELHREVVTTDDDGVARLTFSPGAGGQVQIVAEAEDDRGNRITAVSTVWSSVGSEALTLKAGGLLVLPDKRDYEPGQTARVMVVSPDPDATLLFTEEGGRLLGHRVVKAVGNAAWIEVPLAEAHAPNVFLAVAAVRDGKVRVATRQLVVVPAHRRLSVEVRPDKDVYKAREPGRLTVTTRDAAGKPVAAEVSVAVVDQALFALSPKLAPDLLPYFVPRLRNGVGTDTSAATSFHGFGVRSKRLARPPAKPVMADKKMAEMAPSAAAAPAGAARMEDEAAMAEPEAKEEKKKAKGGKDGKPAAEETTREDLVTTLLWRPHVVTGDDGMATVDVTFSDDLTTWHIAAEAVTDDTRVGQTAATTRTRQDLLVRLDPPGALTERDALAVRAVVQNLTDTDLEVQVSLAAEGADVEGAERTVSVPAQDAVGVSWPTVVRGPSEVVLTATATAGSLRDALKVKTAVRPWGAPGAVRQPLELAGDGADARVTLALPATARPGTAKATVRLASGPVAAIRSALPYLAEYPYGCVEQTMSRFVPLLAARGVLSRLGAGDGLPPDADAMVAAGVGRLLALQGEDGAWGWFGGERDALMSAYALYGLALARELGASVPPEALARGVAALAGVPADRDLPYEVRTFTLHALVLAASDAGAEARRDQALQLFDTIDRAKADPFTQAQMILTLARLGRLEEARTAAKDLAAVALRRGGLAAWAGGGPFAGDEVETTAWALRALLAVDPQHADVVPAMAALLAARTGERWASTRDTAAAVLALTDLLAAGAPALEKARVTVSIGGKARPELVIDPADMAAQDVVVEAGDLKAGEVVIGAEKSGRGLLVGEASLTWLEGGEAIEAASSGLTVSRSWSRLTAPQGGAWRVEPLGGSVSEGDVILVEVTVTPDEEQRYVLVEDPLPSGFRRVRDERDYPVAGRSLVPVADHVERRADRTAFFFGRLAGAQTVTYLLRPELPGQIHALPASAALMYRPAVAGRTGSLRLEVQP